MKKKFLVYLIAGGLSVQMTSAQQDSASIEKSLENNKQKIEEISGKIGGLEESYLETKATVDKLKKIKISGYLQAQIRTSIDTTGQLKSDYTNNYDIGEFQGGKLPAATKSVFQVRRARLKAAYETDLTQMVIQLDCLPFTTTRSSDVTSQDTSGKYTVKKSNVFSLTGGGVTVKDAYLRFSEPWLKSIALKLGIFDRPFGYEISYSSSMRESPERSRLFQTLFPGERDMGFSLEYQAGDNLPDWARYLNFKGGMFAANGINIEYDDLRDYIGRLGFSIPLADVNVSIDGGLSGYFGNVKSRSDSLYETKNSAWTLTRGNKWSDIGRQYLGGDLELFYGNIPAFGGVCLRGEVIQGQQPGISGSSGSPKTDQAVKDPLYLRNFSGYYGMVVLNVDPIKCQLVGKYDSYDPNTDLSGNSVKSNSDLSYSTVGCGLIYHWDENVKLMAYYDNVTNETTTANALYNKDLNDDVFTLRIQYKF
jgi:hypothetical protein